MSTPRRIGKHRKYEINPGPLLTTSGVRAFLSERSRFDNQMARKFLLSISAVSALYFYCVS